VEIAVLRALRWLSLQREQDGSWGNPKTATTAMVLLAYLGHGETPGSGEFGDLVRESIAFIMANQDEEGRFALRDGHDYTQPIAAFALAEAYGMTGDEAIGEAAAKAVQRVVNGQNSSGGFSYNLKPTTRNDTSYMAWCAQAIVAAKLTGLSVQVTGLDRCIAKAAEGFGMNYGEKDGSGSFGYTGPGRSRWGLTGAGTLCLQILGASRSNECRGGIAGLEESQFKWKEPGFGSFLYYTYYASQAKFHAGGAAWWRWSQELSRELVGNQRVTRMESSTYTDGEGRQHAVGSWRSPAKREHGFGVVMDTALCTMMLEAYYRHIPVCRNPEAYPVWKGASSVLSRAERARRISLPDVGRGRNREQEPGELRTTDDLIKDALDGVHHRKR
jgi:hypothetical protein